MFAKRRLEVLRQIGQQEVSEIAKRIGDADRKLLFPGGLEYGAPARGTWNIVHTGMLVPEAHEIFVCAEGCLRGVVLTAAEMGAEDRFSTIEVCENNVLYGDMEELITEGVSDILSRLRYKPRAVLLYTSCVHHFMSIDLERVYGVLRKEHPDTDFIDCYMNPIMRKSGITPDELMRRQMFGLLKKRDINEKAINLIGNDLATENTSELITVLRHAGYTVRQINDLKTYDEYQEMAEAKFNITTWPAANAAASHLTRTLGAEHIYMPVTFLGDEIYAEFEKLRELTGADISVLESTKKEAENSLSEAKKVIKDTEICIDYTAFSRPFELAYVLVEHGFNVVHIYADGVTKEDGESFEKLKKMKPDILLSPTVKPEMRVARRETGSKTLAIGQKVAYFTGTDYFVNVVENGGLHGFTGLKRLAELMTDAYENKKDARSLITVKGYGCGGGCCL